MAFFFFANFNKEYLHILEYWRRARLIKNAQSFLLDLQASDKPAERYLGLKYLPSSFKISKYCLIKIIYRLKRFKMNLAE